LIAEVLQLLRDNGVQLGTGAVIALVVTWPIAKWFVRLAEDRWRSAADEQRARVDRLEMRLDRAVGIAAEAAATARRESVGRQLDAISGLWDAYIRLRDATPHFIAAVDFVSSDKASFERALRSPMVAEMLPNFDDGFIGSRMRQVADGDDHWRPLAGEYLWSLYAAHRATMSGVILAVLEFKRTQVANPWFGDPNAARILSAMLTSTELSEFARLPGGKLQWVRDRVEAKFSAEVARVRSGEAASTEALDIAHRTLAAIRESPHAPGVT
jgi:hypothetical protein